MSKKLVILLAEGFEEVEAITPIDYLRRAGIEVCMAAIGDNRMVTGSHGIQVRADALLAEIAGSPGSGGWDGVLLPGGMPGASNLAASKAVGTLLKEMAGAGKLVGAICASPAVVLAPLGLLAGRRFTCFPGMETQVTGGHWEERAVVVDGNIITSRGAGTAGAWAVAIIGELLGPEIGLRIAKTVLLP
jgi:4-methyl-5(b-hydroxyethyl)-thiazole monophosphate biosynthesis